jgi:hypothetical protein
MVRGRADQQALDERGAACGDEVQIGCVVAMLRPQDTRRAEQVGVQTERAQQIAGVVSQAGMLGYGRMDDRVGCRLAQVRRGLGQQQRGW